jgi:alpha 1,3-glucosidase
MLIHPIYICIFVFGFPVRSFERKFYKTCDDSSFCRRFKQWKTISQRPILTVESSTDLEGPADKPYAQQTLRVRSSTEQNANYEFKLMFYKTHGIVRMVVDDISSDQVKTRFRIPDGDVIVDTESLSGLQMHAISNTTVNGTRTISVDGLYRVEILESPFKLSIFNKDGVQVQVINDRNFFGFERYRSSAREECPDGTEMDMACFPGVDTVGQWEEVFGQYTDQKPFGPSAVSIDVNFLNAKAVFGLPPHSTPFNLPVYNEDVSSLSSLFQRLMTEPEDTMFRFFNADIAGYDVNSKMALYGTLPLMYAIHAESSSVSGFLYLNPSETFIGLSRKTNGSKDISSTWLSETGVLDMLMFVGPSAAAISKQYHFVTGLPAFTPMFGLGYHQSRWGWETENVVSEVNEKLDQFAIPCDVLWLDVQHSDGNRYFTWDPINYGNPQRLIRQITSKGRKVVTIIDPHIKVDEDYYVYSEAKAGNFFAKNPNQTDFVGECWPGKSSWIDFTRPEVREWWAGLHSYNKYVGSTPDLFIWNDMNEPAVFNSPEWSIPRHVLFGSPDNPIEHREMHSLYGFYQHKSTFAGLLARDNPAKRPFVLSRSFFVGSHRYGPIWTGDIFASWDHLKMTFGMIQSLAIAGMSFVGADVAGFLGSPTPELFARWHQNAALAYPFYRGHSIIFEPPREIWTFSPEIIRRVKLGIDLRYTLLPYYYTAMAMYAIEGIPMVKPLWYDHMDDENTYLDSLVTEEQIMVGSSLLIRGIFSADIASTSVYLPDQSSFWYDFYRPSAGYVRGGKKVTVAVSSDEIPTFVRAGSIIPRKMRHRSSTKYMKDDPITLHVYLSENMEASGLLYIDDEETMAYKSSQDYALIALEFRGGSISYNRIGGNRAFDSSEMINSVHVIGQNIMSNPNSCGGESFGNLFCHTNR